MGKSVTMKDIAEKLDVSIVTISKALTDKDGVSDELRSIIKKTAEDMNYRHSATAKLEREKKNYNIGVVISSYYVYKDSDAFYLKMYQSLIHYLTKYEYAGILELVDHNMQENKILPQFIEGNKVDGIIVMGQLGTPYLKKLRETGIPIVYLDFYDRHMETDSVITDSVYGSYMITNYLVSMGHRKIAYIGDIKATASILDRYLGYYRSLLVNDIEPRADYLIKDRGDDFLFIEFPFPKDMPTAFVCNCDQIAYILMERLKKEGYRVPEDISVVGFDNDTFAAFSTPRLTTVSVNKDAMTAMAVETLIKRISGTADTSYRKVISGELIIRDSVANINKE